MLEGADDLLKPSVLRRARITRAHETYMLFRNVPFEGLLKDR